MDAEQLRRRLTRLVRNTAGADRVAVGGWWVGNRAGERRVSDDAGAGRLAWRAARRDALGGLRALDAGEIERAELLLWSATDLYITAIESRIEPRDVEFLSNSARPRGRRPKKNTERK